MATTYDGAGTIEIGSVTGIKLVRLDCQKFVSIGVGIKSDGNTNDFIEDNLLKGTLNKTYVLGTSYEYDFSKNALYDFNGLENLTEN